MDTGTAITTQPRSLLFPAEHAGGESTSIVLHLRDNDLPLVAWVGPRHELGPSATGETAAAAVVAAGESTTSLLPEHWRGLYTRPTLRGYRLGSGDHSPAAGRDWSPAFATKEITEAADLFAIDAVDSTAGLALRTEIESLSGGAMRIRHTLTNTGATPYVLDGLEVVLPVPDSHTELLDFTGRHERERSPQRHPIADGLWSREGRWGRTGVDTAGMLVTGPAGFGFAATPVLAAHVAWSGNSVLRLERTSANGTTIGGGELLLPGEVVLQSEDSYRSPWVFFAASSEGLDGIAAAFHGWLRSLPSHPGTQPATLNVWEAVYFTHDLTQLNGLADLAARVGIERYVLDDGWFRHRRDDHAGLGDWFVDEDVWPNGLTPLIDHVRGLGMVFGLWFEPEMVNPDSDLYRAHPDWVLAAGGREPLLYRNQLVLDLTRPEVFDYIFERMTSVLSAHDIGYVKWDFNRDVLDGGSGTRSGAPAVHEQTLAYYRLFDALRAAHPGVMWESCSAGGGRIDLAVLERAGRVWTSDMTDALSRQTMQRWAAQLVAPEYLGAHISAPVSHQTRRTLSIDFRAATALFGAFGIEWDLGEADESDLASVSDWVARYKKFRPLLHTGRVIRIDSPDPAVLLHGVVAADRSQALVAHVQLDESTHNRGLHLRVPGLDPARCYSVHWEGPVDLLHMSVASQVDPEGPVHGALISGAVLAAQGIWIPRRRPETILLTHIRAAD